MMSLIEIKPKLIPSQLLGIALVVTVFLMSGCFSRKIYYDIPPSHHALTGISQLHVDEFSGQNSQFLKDILVQEIYKVPNFDYIEANPEGDLHSAIISGEVMVYSIRDENEVRNETQVNLIQRDVVQRSATSSGRIRKRVFDFAEVPYQERAIHRTLDLEIRFTVTSAETGKVLYKNTEKSSFQQSYIGEEKILLIPLADNEMERLGRMLVLHFLERLNPSLSRKTLELETGTAPLPLTLSMADIGHPRILRGNRYAVAKEYDKAIKVWNYVVFEPQTFDRSERFIFSDAVFAKLKSAKLPARIIQALLALHNQSFTLDELNKKLPEVIGLPHLQTYSAIIKSHAGTSQEQDRLNLSAAHYNIGSVYRLQNLLPLAAYHFAQANAFNPNPRYAQAWTDVQHDLGDFNPLDTTMDRTIEGASKKLAPPEALVKSEKLIFDQEADVPSEQPVGIEPVELPILLDENREVETVAPVETTPTLDLD